MFIVQTTEYTELQPLLSRVHSVMRVKLALAGEGGGRVHAHPLLLHLPSPVKLQCTLQLVGRHTNPVSSLGKYVLCGSNPGELDSKQHIGLDRHRSETRT